MGAQEPGREAPKPLLIAALVLVGALAVGVAALGISRGGEDPQPGGAQQQARRTGPLPVPPVPAPDAESQSCATLVDALPTELVSKRERLSRRDLVQPAPRATVAWGNPDHDPIVLRCGLPRPAELTPTSHLTAVSGVNWLQLSDAGNTTWLAVDRDVFVALTLPAGSGTGPIQDVSDAINRALPRRA